MTLRAFGGGKTPFLAFWKNRIFQSTEKQNKWKKHRRDREPVIKAVGGRFLLGFTHLFEVIDSNNDGAYWDTEKRVKGSRISLPSLDWTIWNVTESDTAVDAVISCEGVENRFGGMEIRVHFKENSPLSMKYDVVIHNYKWKRDEEDTLLVLKMYYTYKGYDSPDSALAIDPNDAGDVEPQSEPTAETSICGQDLDGTVLEGEGTEDSPCDIPSEFCGSSYTPYGSLTGWAASYEDPIFQTGYVGCYKMGYVAAVYEESEAVPEPVTEDIVVKSTQLRDGKRFFISFSHFTDGYTLNYDPEVSVRQFAPPPEGQRVNPVAVLAYTMAAVAGVLLIALVAGVVFVAVARRRSGRGFEGEELRETSA